MTRRRLRRILGRDRSDDAALIETEDTQVIVPVNPDKDIERLQRRTDIRRYVIGGVAVVLAIVLGLLSWFAFTSRDDATAQRDQAVAEKVSLADQIQGECQAGRLAGPVCERSDQITNGTSTPEPGPAGRGIVSTDIINGRLFVTYTDGAVVDAGAVRGDNGRGIVVSEISDGRLVVTYSDGVIRDLGPVTGPEGAKGAPGRGISNVTITSAGELVITYTDQQTVNVGKVVGPQGPQGDQGPKGDTGGTCPDGQTRENYQYPDGRNGSRCVEPAGTTPEGGTGG